MPNEIDSQVRFRSRLTLGDATSELFDSALASVTRQALGAWALTSAALLIINGAPAFAWIPGVILGLGVSTGLMFVPFAWWSISRRGDFMTEEVEADDAGVRVRSPAGEKYQHWAAYRAVRETARTFTLLSKVSVSELFSKSEMSAVEQEAFRRLLARVGLLRRETTLETLRPFIGMAVGIVLALALPLWAWS